MIDAAVARIRFEFQEMPDLVLTLPQIRRLCGLPEDICALAVETLVDRGVLRKADHDRLIVLSAR